MSAFARVRPQVSTPLGELLDIVRFTGNKMLHVEDEPGEIVAIALDDETGPEMVELLLDAANDLVDELITRPRQTSALWTSCPRQSGRRSSVRRARRIPEVSLPSARRDLAAVQVTRELLEWTRDECPELGSRREREQVLLAAWLVSLRSARTRRSYAGDLLGWLDWLAERELDVLAARRVHVDLWVRIQLEAGAAASSVCRRLSALSSFYRYLAGHDLVEAVPTAGVARPSVDRDRTSTIGLDRAQARALLAAADADTGPARLRTAAAIRILLHNGVRTDELLQADVADLTQDRGHRVLEVTRKGGRRTRLPLAPATWDALDAYLTERAEAAGLEHWRQLSGPLLATGPGGRMRQNHLWELVRRLARAAGREVWGTAVRTQPAPQRHHHRPRRRRKPARCAGLRRDTATRAPLAATTTPAAPWAACATPSLRRLG